MIWGRQHNGLIRIFSKSHAGRDVTPRSVNHTFAGVIYIWDHYHDTKDIFQMLTAELVAYAIGAASWSI